MKRTSYLIFLLILNVACDIRYNTIPKNPSWGFFTSKMNGEEWNQTYKNGYQVTQGLTATSGTAAPCSGEFYYINTELYTDRGELRQNISFVKVPRVKGKYKIQPFIIGYCNDSDPVYGILYTQFGDVSGDQYNILTSEDNFVQIDSYDSESKEIKGIFQLTFILERDGGDRTLPDTLRFTEGKFHTKMMDLRGK